MKKNLHFIICLFLTAQITAQFNSSFSDATLGNSLLENTKRNVSYKLYTLNNGMIQVPIRLEYKNLTGIKVNQFSSRVGLGWELYAGGTISRIVMGYPDDEYKDEEEKEGILFNDNLTEIESLDPYTINNEDFEDIVKKDYEPDVFVINAPTFSARFFFDKNNEVISLDRQNLRIESTQDNEGKLNSFTVTDERGVKYIFDQISTVTETTNFVRPSFVVSEIEPDERTYNSTWSLSRIEDPFSNFVNFNYLSENVSYEAQKVEKPQIFKKEGNQSYPTMVGYDFKGVSEINQSNKVLSNIVSNKGHQITFLSGDERLDLPGSRKLDKINVNNVSEYQFHTNYSGSDNNKRLILNEIENNNQLYLKFTYDARELPPRLSFEQDFWGYYNKNNASSLIPTVYIDESNIEKKSFVNYGYSDFDESQYITLNGADRRSTLFTEAGVLKIIEDARGGKKEFQYELNEFLHKGRKIVGNGLRIKEIKYSGIDDNYRRSFLYHDENSNPSGSVVHLPEFSYITPWRNITYIKDRKIYSEVDNTKYLVYFLNTVNLGSANWSDEEKYDITTVRFSFPTNNIFNEYNVFYERVIEEGDQFEGKKIYSYYVPSYKQTFIDSKHRIRPDSDFFESLESVIHENKNSNFGNLPFIPNAISRDNYNSFLKEIKIKNGKGDVIKQTEFLYVEKENNTVLKGLKFTPLEGGDPFLFAAGFSLTPFITHWYLFSTYNLIEDKHLFLMEKTETNFFENGEVKSSISYEYNDEGFIKKESWTSSNGDQYEKHYKYSVDFKGFNLNGLHIDTTVFKNLNEQNRINLPAEVVTFNNGKVIEGEVFKYKLENNAIYLAEKKEFEIDTSRSSDDYLFSFLSPHVGLSTDSRYKTSKYFDLYDDSGNLIQEHRQDGTYNSFIYGYMGKYLVAEIQNLKYDLISKTLIDKIKNETNNVKLEEHLIELRSNHANSLIITKTYFPYIGVRSETSTNGVSTYYEYDDFNRLKAIKDQDGNLIESFEYKYINQDVSVQEEEEEEEEEEFQDNVEYYKIRRCGVQASIEEVWTHAFPKGTFNSGDNVEGGSGVYYVVVSSQTTLPEGYLYRVTPSKSSKCPEYPIK